MSNIYIVGWQMWFMETWILICGIIFWEWKEGFGAFIIWQSVGFLQYQSNFTPNMTYTDWWKCLKTLQLECFRLQAIKVAYKATLMKGIAPSCNSRRYNLRKQKYELKYGKRRKMTWQIISQTPRIPFNVFPTMLSSPSVPPQSCPKRSTCKQPPDTNRAGTHIEMQDLSWIWWTLKRNRDAQ